MPSMRQALVLHLAFTAVLSAWHSRSPRVLGLVISTSIATRSARLSVCSRSAVKGCPVPGPKAGGPHYLARFATERVISTDITATGGNIQLLGLSDRSVEPSTEG